VNIVDSSGWLEYFADAPDAKALARPIGNVERLVVPTISLLEGFRHVLRQRGENVAMQVLAQMRQGRLVPLDGEIALLAAELGIEHRLPLADSVILATARRRGARVWTQDADFQGIEDVCNFAKIAK
jgi:predicted nucleic acid-binding protein